jgi:16S rRNA (adenine1518-N6/adenine1519-N6)-dimethyltransferase
VTLSRSEIRTLLDEHGIRPSSALGQNFVADPNTVRRVVRLSGVEAGRNVVEIGAGLGSLTLALAERGARVVAIEKDRRLVAILRTLVEALEVRVVEADAVTMDWQELLGEGEWSLVANLPYNVATPVVMNVLEAASQVKTFTVMVQREVGERLAAKPGSPAYGAVSVKVAYFGTAKVLGKVPASVFVPRPKVESALVRIERRESVAVDPSEVSAGDLFRLVGAGFAGRRKMLRRSMAGLVDPSAFEAALIDPTARAEDLAVEDWGRLALHATALGGGT